VNPIVHAELSWLAAQGLALRRDRRLVVLAGLAPDLDGLTILLGGQAFERWHHVLTHGITAGLLVAAACGAAARSRLATAAAALAAFHLHLLCDLVGSGPDWPLRYLWPWSGADWSWRGGWELDAWPNLVIGALATLACLAMAGPRGRTVVEVVSAPADARVVEAVRRRLGRPGAAAPAPPGP